MKVRSLMLLTGAVCIPWTVFGQQTSPLTLIHAIAVSGVQGGFNHMSVDPLQQRLFVAAPANGTIEVVDLKNSKALQSIAGERPVAVRFAPEFNQLYAARGQSLYIYDGKTLQQAEKTGLESNLDELQYDPRAKQLARQQQVCIDLL